MKERIHQIVHAIVQSVAETPAGRSGGLSPDVFQRLLKSGFAPDELMEAVELLNRVSESLASYSVDFVQSRALSTHRNISPEEELRMTDEAIDLFQSWQVLGLTSADEDEEILRRVIVAGAGDIDRMELIRIAQQVVNNSSPLSLYLSSEGNVQ